MSCILIEKDPFVEAEAGIGSNISKDQFNIRRPFYGIQIKEPRHAFISIYQDGGNGSLVPISMKDSSAPGGWSNSNHNFVLTDVSETRQEKTQIIETFGDHYTFFYGQKPIVISCQGMLVNTSDFNWKNEWFYNYNNFLRGTKCVENRARVFLGYDDVLVQGYIMNCQVQLSKDLPYVTPFSFNMLLAKEPLDLTSAVADDVPAPGSSGWVNQAEDARYLVDSNGNRTGTTVEYIGSLQSADRYQMDPLTGDSVLLSGASPNVPASVDSPRTASWVSESDPRKRQWRTPDEALLEINTKIAAQQSGTDDVTSRQALRASPSSFQLASRTDAVVSISSALGKGISNSAAAIPDYTG